MLVKVMADAISVGEVTGFNIEVGTSLHLSDEEEERSHGVGRASRSW